jgi:hypothetical protein
MGSKVELRSRHLVRMDEGTDSVKYIDIDDLLNFEEAKLAELVGHGHEHEDGGCSDYTSDESDGEDGGESDDEDKLMEDVNFNEINENKNENKLRYMDAIQYVVKTEGPGEIVRMVEEFKDTEKA